MLLVSSSLDPISQSRIVHPLVHEHDLVYLAQKTLRPTAVRDRLLVYGIVFGEDAFERAYLIDVTGKR